MRRIVGAAVTLVAGVLAAFFLVLVPLFSDGPVDKLHPEYLVSYAMVAGGYLLFAFGAARWSGWHLWSIAWLATPGVLLTILYQDPPWILRLLVLLSLGLGTAAGTMLGRRWSPASER